MTRVRIVEAPCGSGKTAWAAAAPYYSPNLTDPRDACLPHDEWRDHQLSTLRWIMDGGESKSVIALCETKFLQASNYEDVYGFDPLYGRSNYPCAHPDNSGLTCAECLYAEVGMHKCPYATQCPYLSSKARVIASSRASLNYSYWMAAKSFRERYVPALLVCDEAHRLPDIIVNWCGCTVKEKQRVDWQLPDFSPISGKSNGGGIFVQPSTNINSDPTSDALDWLESACDVLRKRYCILRRDNSRGARKRLTKCERLGLKLRNTLDALRTYPHDWYIRSGKTALQFGKERRPGFVCKPLTARHHLSSYFLGGHDTLLMSATIGDAATFAAECGISDYESRTVPHRFAPERRPIYILDAPKMGFKVGESDTEWRARFDKQADVIANFIEQWPRSWSGLIHVTRITEERYLAQRLSKRGLRDRIWYIEGHQEGYMPTDDQLDAWEDHKRTTPNAVLVTCAFGMGYDGLDERINISAKIPFRPWGTEGSFERSWARYNRRRYDAAAALLLAQQQGRNRRGRECDYDTTTETRGANAIADGSLARIRSKLPLDIQESLVDV